MFNKKLKAQVETLETEMQHLETRMQHRNDDIWQMLQHLDNLLGQLITATGHHIVSTPAATVIRKGNKRDGT